MELFLTGVSWSVIYISIMKWLIFVAVFAITLAPFYSDGYIVDPGPVVKATRGMRFVGMWGDGLAYIYGFPLCPTEQSTLITV